MSLQPPRERAIATFKRQFGRPPRWLSRAPGRVNLIGEHTDYNEGFVLPMAIEQAIWVAFAPRNDRQVRLVAADLDSQVSQFSLDSLLPGGAGSPVATARWSNYARGIAWALQGQGMEVTGFDGAISGNVPIGAGLSSSAALDVAMALAYQTASGLNIPRPDLARLCQYSENDFVGVRCGIMDQFISLLGEAGHALLIDCRDLSHRPVPLPPGVRVVVCNSLVKRGLVDSAYNARRAECEAGVAAFQSWKPGVRALREVTVADMEQFGAQLPPNVRKRCRHVVSENRRVMDMVAAMQQGDLAWCGRLMTESHDSLRDDYEVSCLELDALVVVARGAPGYIGARLTGAGFGGCTVNLVHAGAVADFCAAVATSYHLVTGRQTEIYVCDPAAGASVEEIGD